mmetsp:Transcript_6475/g.12978  ORF Transcript_6475/g.12978 Transcript_6475/m.12978 type:complete len:232 (+) Transcript_6475:223-918(+)
MYFFFPPCPPFLMLSTLAATVLSPANSASSPVFFPAPDPQLPTLPTLNLGVITPPLIFMLTPPPPPPGPPTSFPPLVKSLSVKRMRSPTTASLVHSITNTSGAFVGLITTLLSLVLTMITGLYAPETPFSLLALHLNWYKQFGSSPVHLTSLSPPLNTLTHPASMPFLIATPLTLPPFMPLMSFFSTRKQLPPPWPYPTLSRTSLSFVSTTTGAGVAAGAVTTTSPSLNLL